MPVQKCTHPMAGPCLHPWDELQDTDVMLPEQLPQLASYVNCGVEKSLDAMVSEVRQHFPSSSRFMQPTSASVIHLKVIKTKAVRDKSVQGTKKWLSVDRQLQQLEMELAAVGGADIPHPLWLRLDDLRALDEMGFPRQDVVAALIASYVCYRRVQVMGRRSYLRNVRNFQIWTSVASTEWPFLRVDCNNRAWSSAHELALASCDSEGDPSLFVCAHSMGASHQHRIALAVQYLRIQLSSTPSTRGTVTPADSGPLQRMISRDDLWRAAIRGDLPMVQHFLEEMRGVLSATDFDIDIASPFGRSALYQAALGGHTSTVRWLIEQGASDPNGVAYLACTNPQTREVMAAAGFKGKHFDAEYRVRLLRAERRLVLALAVMHERLGNAIDGMLGMDYDVLMLLVRASDRIFRDKRVYRQVVKRFDRERTRMQRTNINHINIEKKSTRRGTVKHALDAERRGTIQARAAQAMAERQHALSEDALRRTRQELKALHTHR
jgi:hypothetical protein